MRTFSILTILFVASRLSAAVYPADSAYTTPLDGTWRFKIEQKEPDPDHGTIGGQPREIVLPKQFEPFEKIDYVEDGTWKEIGVPGNWEIAGFSPATYNQPDNVVGLYRLRVDVPSNWKGRLVKLNFDGVQNGAEVYCNGQPVNVDEPSDGRANFHQGGNTAFQADLTPAVKFGQKNLLAVRVYKNTKAVDLDSGDFFLLGGIHRPVTLFSIPATHLDDLAIRTKLLDGGKAELLVRLNVAAPSGAKASMQMEGQPIVEASIGDDGKVELRQVLDHPRLWSAEHPNLYSLHVVLRDSRGEPTEQLDRRVGVREISIKDGVYCINNVPVKFTGMCRHELYPSLGSAINEEVWRKDITLMKWANVNAIRTSHYPYGSCFYDLCDELGMYVMDEVSAGWCSADDPSLAPAWGQHAREMVRRDKNHPSIVVWAVGNENKEGPNNKVAADEIGKLDDTRPRLVSWRKGDDYGVELDDLHYTNPPKIAQLNADTQRRKKYPIIFLENPNDFEVRNGADYGCLDLWGHVIDRTWREVWKDDHVPGSFLWEWADRAVADQYPKKLYDYFPGSGINLAKVKGQVDGFRNPRAGLYHVKMAYAPIVIDLKSQISDSAVTVHVTNRFSFTDLSELKATWHLLAGEKEIKAGDVTTPLAPRRAGDIKIDVPADVLKQADGMRIDLEYRDGRNIANYLVRLKPETDTTPKFDPANLAGVNFPRLNLVPVTYDRNAIGWRWAYRHPVKLTKITANTERVPDEAALLAMPLANVKQMEADLVESDAPDKVVGHVTVGFADGQFIYRIDWSKPNGPKNAPTDIHELGWTFTMPKQADHFSWHRQAQWSWYPSTHIGRPSGTATPDSANVDITKITRPDAFDFNSSKYDCDWARLADESGRGLVVAFEPDLRHHCRGGINSADGTYQLVVNRYCAPPRDLSSGVVPDLYFTLARGASAEGHFKLGTSASR